MDCIRSQGGSRSILGHIVDENGFQISYKYADMSQGSLSLMSWRSAASRYRLRLAAVGRLLVAPMAAAMMAWPALAAAPRPPDVIYHNGRVMTVNQTFGVAEAFAVSGDRFVAVGDNASVRALAGARTRSVDLRGATVVPGMSDNHDHLWNSARFEFRGTDVIGVTSSEELQQRLGRAVAAARPGEVVFTTLGWNVVPAPTRKDLDAVSTTVPIALIGSRQGRSMLNSAALKRLGIDSDNPWFNGARVPVDAAGEPTGATPPYPRGLQMIETLLPALTPAVEDMMVSRAIARRHALGITSIRELSIWPSAVRAYQRMRRAGRLDIRMALGLEYPDQPATAQYLARLALPMRDDPWLVLDAMSEEPWPPGATTQEDFTAQIRVARQRGWRVAPHVSADVARGVGYDEATDDTLAAYEILDRERPLQGQRWYLEHVPFATPLQIERIARLGLIASVQLHGYESGGLAPMPAGRFEHLLPLRSLLDRGITVISGSDYTSPTAVEAEPNNPMLRFYFYVTRKNRRGELVAPAERISRQEALRILTANSAYANFQEASRGQISVGMLADFVILNLDPLTVPEDQLLLTRPLATFVGGRRVYTAGSGY
jgi:predicted amidohydrolase YtcJ